MGLLGLMLLQESRRAARSSPEGDLILLEQQDRSLWNRDQIAEGISLTESALASRRFGAYTLQAAIAAVHAESFLRRHPPTGARSHCSTTGCFVFSHPRSWNSTAQLPSPCARGRSRVFVSSMPCWRARNSPTITSRTPPGRTCAAGWEGLRRRVTSYEKALALVRLRARASVPRRAAEGVAIKTWLCCRFSLCPATIG